MSLASWPPVVSIDTPLAVHLCPQVGRGLLVVSAEATEAEFGDTAEVLRLIEWTISDAVVGINDAGAEVVELSGEPTDVVTAEALAGADEQLLRLAGLAQPEVDAE